MKCSGKLNLHAGSQAGKQWYGEAFAHVVIIALVSQLAVLYIGIYAQ